MDPIPTPYLDEKIPKDLGHTGLVDDIASVYRDANVYAFHDYKGKKYPLPKVALVASLEKIIQRAKSGYYKNIL